MRRLIGRTVEGRLRIVILGIVAASVLLSGGLLILTSSRVSTEQLRLVQQASASLSAEQVSSYIDDLQRKLAFLARVRGLASFDPVVQREILAALGGQNKAYETVGIVDAQGLLGQAVSLTDEPAPSDWVATQAFRRTLLEHEDYVGAVERRAEPSPPSLILAVPIRDLGNQVVGMLFAKVSLKFLPAILDEASTTDGAYTYLVDQRRVVIAHSAQVPDSSAFADLSLRPLGERFDPGTTAGGGPYAGLLGVEVLGEVASVSSTGWRVVTELPVSQAYAPILALAGLMGVGLALALVVALLVSVWLASQFTRPLRQLTTTTERLRAGDLSARVAVDRDNEFGVLAGAFNDMATQLADTIVGQSREMAEREAAEAALRERARLLDLAHDAIIVRDPDSRVVYWSRGAVAIYGWPAEEATGHVTHDLLQTTFPVSRAATDAALESAGEWTGDLRHTARDGRGLTVESRQSVERDARGRIRAVLEINRDITERRLADQARASLEAQLAQAQRMESVGRLAGGVAHDFNNMLAAILGTAEIALEALDPSHPVRADLLEIKDAARRSADLTRQLLAFARRQTATPKVLDLNEAVGGMLDMLRRLVLAGVELSWRPGADPWPVLVDPSQLDQVLTNLVVNAGDVIGAVGTVIIETGNATLDADDCAARPGAVPGEYVVLTVGDNGRGMDAETLSHIFEPFFTTKESGKGTGLGLATVYGIARQNEGFIDAESELGTGSTFRVYLPRHRGPATAPEARPQGVAAGGGETVLLVEDEPAILRLATAMLERLGYHVIAAATPREAIRLAREHSGELHLLMTDVVMPGMTGPDLARSLLSLHPRLGLLYMSGYTADIIADHGVLDEGVHFLQKPFSARDLAARVREALDQDPVSADPPAG